MIVPESSIDLPDFATSKTRLLTTPPMDHGTQVEGLFIQEFLTRGGETLCSETGSKVEIN